MALRPSAAICLVLAAAVLARAGEGDAPAPSKPAEAVKFGPAPDGLCLLIAVPKASYWPGELIQPQVTLVNDSDKAINVVLPREGSECGAREPSLTWTAAYVAADGTETPVPPHAPGRCGTGLDFVWQDDVIALGPGRRAALEHVEAPSIPFDLQAPGKVRLRLRYAYSAGKTTKAPDVLYVEKGTGAMGAQAPFELVGAVDVTVERPLEVTVQASSSPRAGTETRLAEFLEVRAIGKDGRPHALPASHWELTFQFDAPTLGLETAKCWQWHALARDAAVAAGGSATLALDSSLTLRAAKPGTCRVRAALRCMDPPGAARIASAWTELRFTE